MANPIRNNDINFDAEKNYNGMYIISESNARELDIPQLPILIRDSSPRSNNSVSVFEKKEDLEDEGIICENLFSNFSKGDIVWIDNKKKTIKTILSKQSNANTLLLTEQCENRCLFCSQPPNHFSDTHLYSNALLALLNYNTNQFIGLSGGEPTKNRTAFIRLLDNLNQYKIPTKLHILTHGRNFSDRNFTSNVANLCQKREILWGIPVYGHKSSIHDHLVDSENAFTETIQGLSYLSEHGQCIEIRIVPNTHNIQYISNIIMFVASNYTTLKTISIMNLEPKGLGRKNYKSLYVSIKEQNKHLLDAVNVGTRFGIDIRLFNYPLCLLDTDLRKNAVKSISDWKNYYPEDCTNCSLINECGGFFTSAKGNFIEKVEAQHE